MPEGLPEGPEGRIETFQSRSEAGSGGVEPHDLQGLWRCEGPAGDTIAALQHPWGARHRPDWHARGLVIWPRGGQWRTLRLRLARPAGWAGLDPEQARARLALRWWADQVELRVEGAVVHRGDLFDTACRWELPLPWWQGQALELELRLRSPLHDDGALIHSRLEAEPRQQGDPLGLLAPTVAALQELRRQAGVPLEPGPGPVHVLGHAHLDLAWLWPVADTWQAAERTFRSCLALLERFPELHFGHSTPALYAWLEQHRPTLFGAIQAAAAAGRWEPLNGPWVETDCVLVGTASLLRQFQEGQQYSRSAFPTWPATVAWLPDSFGFSAGLPAVAAATGVRWFATHKLAWNATNPFPHRLFRWRSRCGSEVLALVTAPIGTDGDPLAIEQHRLAWQAATGCAEALWLPGVGDHGGGPTAEMLEQLALWRHHPAAAPQHHGSLRGFLATLEPLAPQLPVWRDELYLELHRGCATSRPDQKRHNRTLERLLREADLARALAEPGRAGANGSEAVDWRPLLFQQFHDILPGTSIPEVFEQAEPQWRAARRRARRQRDQALGAAPAPNAREAGQGAQGAETWRVCQLLPLPPVPRTLRLPAGHWSLIHAAGATPLPGQPAPGGGQWIQLPALAGAGSLRLRRQLPARPAAPGEERITATDPVRLERAPTWGPDHWRLGNGLITVVMSPRGVEQLLDHQGQPQLAGPLAWCRWADRGEFWDAWDIASDYRDHPLPWTWEGPPQWLEHGPLCGRFVQRGRVGGSPVRLEGRLLAAQPWLELVLSVHWRQRHELLRLELPLAAPALRWAADTPAGVIERPATPRSPREQSRWEVPCLAWLASVGAPAVGGGLAVLLDGPQGVDASAERLGVSLLRGPTWPDPGADNGWQRQRLALMPCPEGWRAAQVPTQARRLREPLWCHPVIPAVGSEAWSWPALDDDLVLVELAELPASGSASRSLRLSVHNEGPCRRRVTVPAGWRLAQRLDGLGDPLDPQPSPEAQACLHPWQLGFWRVERA